MNFSDEKKANYQKIYGKFIFEMNFFMIEINNILIKSRFFRGTDKLIDKVDVL